MHNPLLPYTVVLAQAADPGRRAGCLLSMARVASDEAMAHRHLAELGDPAADLQTERQWWCTAAVYLLLADVEHTVASLGVRRQMTLVQAQSDVRGNDRDRFLAAYARDLAVGPAARILAAMATRGSLGDRQTLLADLCLALKPTFGTRTDAMLMSIMAPGYAGWKPVPAWRHTLLYRVWGGAVFWWTGALSTFTIVWWGRGLAGQERTAAAAVGIMLLLLTSFVRLRGIARRTAERSASRVVDHATTELIHIT